MDLSSLVSYSPYTVNIEILTLSNYSVILIILILISNTNAWNF